MNEGIKKVDLNFEKEKEDIKWKNQQEKTKYLMSKFSEVLAQNPIEIYTKYGDRIEKVGIIFDKIERVTTDESGTGGNIEVIFNNNNYIAVSKRGFGSSSLFGKEGQHKIKKEAFQNILTMMSELIKASGYSETEKSKMLQDVVDNFKDNIIE